MSKGENIVKWIKGQRISWLGHLERMEEDRMHKEIFTQEQEGTRRRGRPRKRWKEEVERDLQVLVVRRWRDLVAGKNGRTLFDRLKATVGCSANGRRRRTESNTFSRVRGVAEVCLQTTTPTPRKPCRINYLQAPVLCTSECHTNNRTDRARRLSPSA